MKPIFSFPPVLTNNDYKRETKFSQKIFSMYATQNCCLHIAKLLYSLTVLKYLDNEDLISSKPSLKYKQYIPIIIAKQYMVIQSQGVKIHLGI